MKLGLFFILYLFVKKSLHGQELANEMTWPEREKKPSPEPYIPH